MRGLHGARKEASVYSLIARPTFQLRKTATQGEAALYGYDDHPTAQQVMCDEPRFLASARRRGFSVVGRKTVAHPAHRRWLTWLHPETYLDEPLGYVR